MLCEFSLNMCVATRSPHWPGKAAPINMDEFLLAPDTQRQSEPNRRILAESLRLP